MQAEITFTGGVCPEGRRAIVVLRPSKDDIDKYGVPVPEGKGDVDSHDAIVPYDADIEGWANDYVAGYLAGCLANAERRKIEPTTVTVAIDDDAVRAAAAGIAEAAELALIEARGDTDSRDE